VYRSLASNHAASMFDLRDVVTYIARRVGLIPRRVWLGARNTFNMSLRARASQCFPRLDLRATLNHRTTGRHMRLMHSGPWR
jgi:hypothetical protein